MKLSKRQTLGEEIANAISHGVGAILSIVGTILMIVKASTPLEIVGVTLFGATGIILYTMSTLYHSFKHESTTKKVFRRFDHLSIYLLIGGTYLPVFLITINYPYNMIFLIVQWTIIITGVTLIAASFNRFRVIHFIFYLILGWSGVIAFRYLLAYSKGAFYFILAGGISYTIGAVIYAIRKFKYYHFIWHLFVLGGTVLHFFAIYLYLL